MTKRITNLGNIALTALVHETIIRNGKKGIFIPVDVNPCIYFSQKEDGKKVVNLDIEVKPTPNSKYGNNFLVKANVGKANREKFHITRENIDKYSPILGNLKEFSFEVSDAQQGPAPQAPPEDLPDEMNDTW